MAILEILKFPDPRLRIKAQPVTAITDEMRKQVTDMYETMYHTQGVGLAAAQVNIPYQFFTMDISEQQDAGICAFNPQIISRSGIQYEGEACLSVGGGAFDKVERALHVRLRAMNLDGEIFELDAEGLMAACIQHEIDHLNGILFIDHLSRLKQDRIKKKIEKENRK